MGREGVRLGAPDPAALAGDSAEFGRGHLPFGHRQLRLGRLKGQFVGPILPRQGEGLSRVPLVLHRDLSGLPGAYLLGPEVAAELRIGGHGQGPFHFGHLVWGILAGDSNGQRVASRPALRGAGRLDGEGHFLLRARHQANGRGGDRHPVGRYTLHRHFEVVNHRTLVEDNDRRRRTAAWFNRELSHLHKHADPSGAWAGADQAGSHHRPVGAKHGGPCGRSLSGPLQAKPTIADAQLFVRCPHFGHARQQLDVGQIGAIGAIQVCDFVVGPVELHPSVTTGHFGVVEHHVIVG